MKEGYIIRYLEKTHFITATVVDWIDVFTKKTYKDVINESLAYGIKEKGMLPTGARLSKEETRPILKSVSNAKKKIK